MQQFVAECDADLSIFSWSPTDAHFYGNVQKKTVATRENDYPSKLIIL